MNTGTYARIAAVLLALVGLARGAGGVFMLLGGVATAGAGSRADAPTGLIGGGLILVGALCLTAAALNFKRHPAGRWVGGAALVTFVAGGLVNGQLLYGRPRIGGVAGNLAYALLTFAVLWQGTRPPNPIREQGHVPERRKAEPSSE